MDDFRRPPQRPQQRPIHDFGPRPTQRVHGPITDLRPQAQQPLRQPVQRPQQPHHVHQPQPQGASQTPKPADFSPPAKKKRQLAKPRKAILAASTVAMLVVGSFIFINSNNHTPASQTKAKQPTRKAFETPGFTTYYPNYLPTGLNTAKGSIAYYKDSFTFIIAQAGQNQFFVYENPASSDPGLKTLRGTLTAPKDITLTTGKGIQGTLDVRTIIAVTTDKGTILRISCSKAGCGTTAKQILNSMQSGDSAENLRRSNS